jgi:DNA-binding IclR family transcriptional regulator
VSGTNLSGVLKRLTATMAPAAIAKHLGIARSSVYRLLEPAKAA